MMNGRADETRRGLFANMAVRAAAMAATVVLSRAAAAEAAVVAGGVSVETARVQWAAAVQKLNELGDNYGTIAKVKARTREFRL
jgi:hypothetical protein